MMLEEFRQQKDNFFRQPDSPLLPEDQAGFSGLKYFPENPSLRLTVALDEDVAHDFVMMPTSTGSQKRYVRGGKISFQVQGQPVAFFLYKDDTGWFLPFRDGTSDQETYGAGRYLEPREAEAGKLLVDFNFAYNPYCAYNEHYSCPIPPRENWTKVRIEAGEMRFHH
ncbi:MAG: DUF1684 domain-containing protein [Candidatus Kerfeldbacteria bacterium]|nr:DUF1684 domain-containing protein [Candidatus Kerfeldbacteria bacterium]